MAATLPPALPQHPKPRPSLLTLPQKRGLTNNHSPAIPSPLRDDGVPSKAKREKKESQKKRESKGISNAYAPIREEIQSAGQGEDSPPRYLFQTPIPSDYQNPRNPNLSDTRLQRNSLSNDRVHYFELNGMVHNKPRFRYIPCILDPAFTHIHQARQTEAEPYCARLSFEDSAAHVMFGPTATQATTSKGFRMVRANVGVREGRWFWECKIKRGVGSPDSSRMGSADLSSSQKPEPHVRIGWARREASLEAPVGFDSYSYGIRDVSGQRVHKSRPTDFFPKGQDIREGDVIGVEINLPTLQLHRKVVGDDFHPHADVPGSELPRGPGLENVIRDRATVRAKNQQYFEQAEYGPTKELEDYFSPSLAASSHQIQSTDKIGPAPLRTLPDSWIQIYKNGKLMGKMFENLLAFLPPASVIQTSQGVKHNYDDGFLGYFPAVSMYTGGIVETNFGPDFVHPPSGLKAENQEATSGDMPPVRALYERYNEQIAEDILYDLIDEVDFWEKDKANPALLGASRVVTPDAGAADVAPALETPTPQPVPP